MFALIIIDLSVYLHLLCAIILLFSVLCAIIIDLSLSVLSRLRLSEALSVLGHSRFVLNLLLLLSVLTALWCTVRALKFTS